MLSIVKGTFGENDYKTGFMNDTEVITETKNDGYLCIRKQAGYIPITFYKYIKISDDYIKTIDSLVTKNVVFMNDGQNMSAYILTDDGTIDCYISIYKNEGSILLEIYNWDYDKVKKILNNAECELLDVDLNCILVEGPESKQLLLDLLDVDIDYLSYQNHEYFDCNGMEIFIARTGYTGEFGYKILGNKQHIRNVLRKFADAKAGAFLGINVIKQCMIEVKQPDFQLSYTKFSQNIFELDYQWFVDFKKDTDFRGKEALYGKIAAGITKNTICALSNIRLEISAEVKDGNDVIGTLIDCQYSKVLNKYIVALLIEKKYAQAGFEYSVQGEFVSTVSAPYIVPRSWIIGKEDN